MPELRQDPTTKDWIILATERAKRPHDFRSPAARAAQPAFDEHCPFCPGHETSTPPAVLAYPDSGAARWSVRVVPNKFAALVPEGSTERRVAHDFFREMDGVGHHEVIIETPVHNRFIRSMEPQEVEAFLRAYRERYLALRADPRVKLILIFKNHGEAAGTSLLHPHSQLVATPVVPSYIRRKYDEAMRYCESTGHCLYCDLLEAERRDRREGCSRDAGFHRGSIRISLRKARSRPGSFRSGTALAGLTPAGCTGISCHNARMDHLLAALDEAFDRKSWHGTNLRGSIRGLTAEQAAWRPCSGRHSIQELVVHAAYWKYVVRRKLTGAKRGSFPEPGSNWFARSDQPDHAAWKRDVALLVSEHKLLRQAIADLSPSDLRDPKKLQLIRGVAAHDLYHAGQIQLLKRLS